ncbi:MATE family efflux transporter [Faecalicoccus pleomorphus]|uniref:Multidrug export protein MepA n=1 Tax=Faecalicoccus pleomorphus TaxID=1323 RepID=A0A7X9RKM6_9FIRM|nr:MATE family efflux transporter [Faecalicoccus pleomorphus]NME45444.1 MATE family efflux transporter [Faecalicoccus pleomorphus]
MENILGIEKPSKLLRSFAITSIISMLVSSLYNIVDQIFIGQGVGYLGNAATNVAFPLTTITLAISLLIGIGSASRFSLYLGAKEYDRARHVIGNGIMAMLISSVIYVILVFLFLIPLMRAFGATDRILPYALQYTSITTLGAPFLIGTNVLSNMIRADGSPKYSMACMLVGAAMNTILDPIFIFIFSMGVAGAAWATVIGQVGSFVVGAIYLKNFKHVQLERKDFRFSLYQTLETAAIGISASINQCAILVVQIVLNNSLVYYGQFSVYGQDIPLAACGIVMKVNSILMAVIIGISQGTQPIVGFNYGAKSYERVRQTLRLSLSYGLAVSIIGWACFQLFTAPILSLFGTGDPLYFEFAIHFMKIFLSLTCVISIQIISSGYFSAVGKPLKGMVLSLTRQVLFFIPLVLILPHFLGLDGIMYSAPVADGVAFVVSLIFVLREWKHLKRLEIEG